MKPISMIAFLILDVFLLMGDVLFSPFFYLPHYILLQLKESIVKGLKTDQHICVHIWQSFVYWYWPTCFIDYCRYYVAYLYGSCKWSNSYTSYHEFHVTRLWFHPFLVVNSNECFFLFRWKLRTLNDNAGEKVTTEDDKQWPREW